MWGARTSTLMLAAGLPHDRWPTCSCAVIPDCRSSKMESMALATAALWLPTRCGCGTLAASAGLCSKGWHSDENPKTEASTGLPTCLEGGCCSRGSANASKRCKSCRLSHKVTGRNLTSTSMPSSLEALSAGFEALMHREGEPPSALRPPLQHSTGQICNEDHEHEHTEVQGIYSNRILG